MLQRNPTVAASPASERRVKGTGVEESSRSSLVDRYFLTLLPLSVCPALRFLRHVSLLSCEPPFQGSGPAAPVACSVRAVLSLDGAARRVMVCGRPGGSGATPRTKAPAAGPDPS